MVLVGAVPERPSVHLSGHLGTRDEDSSKCVACAFASEDVLLGILVNPDDVADVCHRTRSTGPSYFMPSASLHGYNCPWAAVSASEARLEYPNRLKPRA